MPVKARYFYALRPDAAAARSLDALAARLAANLGGRSLSAGDVHLTLVFVGERPVEDEATLASLLDGLAPRWPAMPLTKLGTFGRGLFWAGPANPQGMSEGDAGTPAWPAQLAAQLQQRLRDAGIAFDERTLHLHATLVRGARRDARSPLAPFSDALPIESGCWTLALGCSDAGSTPRQAVRPRVRTATI